MLDVVHVVLNILVIGLHGLSLVTLLRCVSEYQDTNPFTYSGKRWFSVFDMDGEELGIYLIRLIIGACLIMFAMNFWHLFTYYNETAPIVKNVSWRTGNFLVALIFFVYWRLLLKGRVKRRDFYG